MKLGTKTADVILSGDTLFTAGVSNVVQLVNMFSSGAPEDSVWSAGVLITSLQIAHAPHHTTQ